MVSVPLEVRRSGHVWNRSGTGRPTGARCIGSLFPRPPQGRRFHWTVLLFRSRSQCCSPKLNLPLGTNNFVAADLHGLNSHYLVSHNANEIYVVRRLAVDPVFIFILAVLFPDFLLWAAFRIS